MQMRGSGGKMIWAIFLRLSTFTSNRSFARWRMRLTGPDKINFASRGSFRSISKFKPFGFSIWPCR